MEDMNVFKDNIESRNYRQLQQEIEFNDFTGKSLLNILDNAKIILCDEISKDLNSPYWKSPTKDVLISEFRKIEKAYLAKYGTFTDISNTDSMISENQKAIVEEIEITKDCSSLWVQTPRNCLGYGLTLPRGFYSRAKLVGSLCSKVLVQNRFNIYPTEGFTLSIDRGNMMTIVLNTEEIAGIKGRTELFIYIADNTGIVKDLASKYLDVSNVMNVISGNY